MGKLMVESHAACNTITIVSAWNWDSLVEPRGIDGVYGSRMTGADSAVVR